MTHTPLSDHEARELAHKTREYAANIFTAMITLKSPSATTATDNLLRDTINVCLWQQEQLDKALTRLEAQETAIRELQAAARDREGDL